MKHTKAEREEQARLADEYTTLREGYTQTERPKAWKRWRLFWGKGYYFVRLSGGEIVSIAKPFIQTRFCCGEDDRGQGGDDLDNKRTEAGFKRANLGAFDERMMRCVGRKAWRVARACNDRCRDNRPAPDRSAFVPCIAQGACAGNEDFRYFANARCLANCETLVRYLTDDDFRRMRRAYMTVRTDFKQRLNVYWKRFDASKIRTWTY